MNRPGARLRSVLALAVIRDPMGHAAGRSNDPSGGPGPAPSTAWLREVYRRRAKRYGLTSRIYLLGGFRYDAYRKEAIRALRLRPGQTVVDLGCGTGENLSALRNAVGPGGSVVGIDLTDAMLAVARRRVARAGWDNVHLVAADAQAWPLAMRADACLASFSLAFMPDTDRVITEVARDLGPDGRFVVLDYDRAPARWPKPLVALMGPLLRPFGATAAQDRHDPLAALERGFDVVERRRRYLGMVRLDIAWRPRRSV